MEANNMAAMREALTKVKEWMEHRIATCGFEASATFPTMLEDVVLPALAKPPRNCDVGTAEEQTERFKQLCRKYRRGPGPRTNCKGCPISRESKHVGCTFAWAQMSYNESEAK